MSLKKESLNGDNQQFHQFRQMKQSRITYNHWKMITEYDATNSGPGLGQVLKCGEAKPDLLCLSSKNSTYKDSGLFSE
jgi:hypothetical protein